MDLDLEELEATRNKSADEMFEELGFYKKIISEELSYTNNKEIRYLRHSDKCLIKFDLNFKQVLCEYIGGLSSSITMQELKAINKKVEELGW